MSRELTDLQTTLRIGNVADGKTLNIETDGFIANVGRFAYRDEYPSAPWVAAGNAAAPNLEDHTIGGVPRKVWCFNGTTTEETLSSSFEIPHDYAEGQLIEVHVHFRPTTNDAGNVKFFFDWEHSPVDSAPEAQTSLSSITIIAANSQYYHKLKAFGTLPANGYTLGDKIGFNIRRDPTDDEDTYGAKVILEQVAMHVPVDTLGSRQIYIK